MNNLEGKSYFGVGLDYESFSSDAAKIRAEFRSMGDAGVAEGARIDRAWTQAKTAIGGVLTFRAATSFVSQVYKIRSAFQDAESSMSIFLGSADKANKFLDELKDYAWYNMFEFSDLVQESQKLLAFRTNVEDIIPTLDKLSNIAAGTQKPLSDLVDLYNKAKSTGKIDAKGLETWGNSGVAIIETLKDMGLEVDRSSVKFEHLQKVLNHLTSDGGMFAGIMDSQMQNLSASWGQLQDDIALMFNEIGVSMQDAMKKGIEFGSYLVDNYKEIGKNLGELVIAYGAYRTALATVAALRKAETDVLYTTEIAELGKLTDAKQADANADLEAAVASGRLTEAKAAHIAALRQETAAKLDGMKTTAAALKMELAAAEETHRAALTRALTAKSMVSQREMELSLAQLSGDAAQVELASKVLLEAQEERHIAVKARKATADELALSRSKSIAATTAVETMQANLNTVSQTANTTSTNLLTVAKTKLTAAATKLQKRLMANPYALAAAAVIGLAYGIYKLATYQTEAEKAQAKLNKTIKESETAIAAERHQVDLLFARLKAAKEGTEEYAAARKAIMDKYGDYLRKLGDEKTALEDIAAAYKLITEEAAKAARARAMETATKDAAETLASRESDVYDQVKKILQKKFGREQGDLLMLKFKPVIMDGEELTQELQEIIGQFDKTFNYTSPENGMVTASVTTNDLKDQLQKVFGARAIYNRTMQEALLKFGETPKTDEGGGEDDPVIKRNKAFWENQKKEAEAALEAMEEAEKGTEEWNRQLALLQEAQAALKVWDFNNIAKNAKQYKKHLDDLADAIKQGDLELAQARVDIMADGTEKRLAQLEIDKQRTLAAIDKEERELKKKYQEAGREFTEEDAERFETLRTLALQRADKDRREIERENTEYVQGLYRQLSNVFLTEEERKLEAIRYRYKTEREKLDKDLRGGNISVDDYTTLMAKSREAEEREINEALLGQFGDYYQKRAALVTEWEARIAAIPAEYRDEAKRQRDAELADLDSSMKSHSVLWAQLFEDTTYRTSKQLKSIADNAKAVLDYVSRTPLDQIQGGVGGLTAEQLRNLKLNVDQLSEAYKRLYEIQNQRNALNPFGSLISAIKTYKAECERAKAAQDAVFAAKQKEQNEQRKLSFMRAGIASGIYSEEDVKRQEKALKSAKQAREEAEAAADAAEQGAESAIGGILGAVSEVGKALSQVGSILSECGDAFDNQALADAGMAISLIGDTASKLAEGDFLGAIAGVFSAWAQAAKRHREALKAIQDSAIAYQLRYNQVLHETKMLMEDLTNVFTEDKIAQAQRFFQIMIDKRAELESQLAGESKTRMNYLFNNSGWRRYQEMEAQGLGALADARVVTGHKKTGLFGWGKGKDVYSSLLDVFPELITQSGKFDASVAQTILDTRKLDDYTKNLLETLIQTTEQIEEAEQALRDYLTETFGAIGAGLGDAIVEAFETGGDAMELWRDNFVSVLKDLGKQIMTNLFFQKMFDQLQDDLANIYGKDISADQLGNEVTALLGNFFNNMHGTVAAAEDFYEQYVEQAKKWGFDLTGDSRETSQKGVTAASQDSIDDLRGITTNMQYNTHRTAENVEIITPAVQLMAANTTDIKMGMDVLRGNASKMLEHLENIDNHTSHLEQIGKDISSVKAGISDINTKGIELKR